MFSGAEEYGPDPFDTSESPFSIFGSEIGVLEVPGEVSVAVDPTDALPLSAEGGSDLFFP